MPDNIAAWRMHPNAWLVGSRWIGNEDELIAWAQPMQDLIALAEHRAVDGCLEFTRSGQNGRHIRTVRRVTQSGQFQAFGVDFLLATVTVWSGLSSD
jgi:hypothetical protein